MSKRISKYPIIAIALFAALVTAAIVFSDEAQAAAQKIFFFIDGKAPTSAERAKIVKLEATEGPAFDVHVLNIKKVTRCPSGTAYIAGIIPAACRDGGIDSGTPLYTEADPDNPPRPNTLPATQAKVYNGQVISIAGGGSYTLTVAGGVITAVAYVAPDAGT